MVGVGTHLTVVKSDPVTVTGVSTSEPKMERGDVGQELCHPSDKIFPLQEGDEFREISRIILSIDNDTDDSGR